MKDLFISSGLIVFIGIIYYFTYCPLTGLIDYLGHKNKDSFLYSYGDYLVVSWTVIGLIGIPLVFLLNIAIRLIFFLSNAALIFKVVEFLIVLLMIFSLFMVIKYLILLGACGPIYEVEKKAKAFKKWLIVLVCLMLLFLIVLFFASIS